MLEETPEVLLQSATIALQKMRRSDSGAEIWKVDREFGHNDNSMWVRANAPVLHAFRQRPESDAGSSPTTVEMFCTVTYFNAGDRLFTGYTLDFNEHVFQFEGGFNEDLVLATCAQIAFYLLEKRMLQPNDVAGYWQMIEGSWNYPYIVELFSNKTVTSVVAIQLIALGMLTASPDLTDRLAWIRSVAVPNQQQIANSGLRLDGVYGYAMSDVAAGQPRFYLRFYQDGGLEFVTAQTEAEARRLLQPQRNYNHSQSLYQLIGSTIRFSLWAADWTMDFQGSIGSDGLRLSGAHRNRPGSSDSFWQYLGPQTARVESLLSS